jgi:hypothetical protein
VLDIIMANSTATATSVQLLDKKSISIRRLIIKSRIIYLHARRTCYARSYHITGIMITKQLLYTSLKPGVENHRKSLTITADNF